MLPIEDRECELHKNLGEFVASYHSTGGRWMRNHWLLDQDGDLYNWFTERGFTHADDMSATIFTAYWCKVKGEYFYIGDEADKFRAYWDSMETIPITQTIDIGDGKKVTIINGN